MVHLSNMDMMNLEKKKIKGDMCLACAMRKRDLSIQQTESDIKDRF